MSYPTDHDTNKVKLHWNFSIKNKRCMGCDYPIKVNDIQVNVAKIDTKNFQYAKRYHLKCVTIPAYISPKLLTMSVNLTTEAT